MSTESEPRPVLVYQIVRMRNNQESRYDVEADNYKAETNKTVTLYRNEQPVGTFYDVDHIRAIKIGPVHVDPQVGEALDALMKRNLDNKKKVDVDDDDEYDDWLRTVGYLPSP